ncbi:MAG: HAD-IC family P-type ATPase, partial [Chitinivibrionales bacterium]|nr:HAD-IC family P-type ATPase [Chitinivibrionales bacterium]
MHDNGPPASIEETLKTFGVNAGSGLSDAEVRLRQSRGGYNELPEKKDPALFKLGRKFLGLTSGMLEITMIVSFLLHRYFDFSIIAALLIVNVLIGFSQEQRAAKAVEALRRRLRVNARVLRNSVWRIVVARELVPGDIIRARAGDFVPADTKIIEGAVAVDQSALTGESLSQEKKNNDELYSGSVIVRGEVTAVVTRTGAKTYFGRTSELLQRARPKLHLEELTSKIVTWLLIIVLALIAVIFGISYLRGANLVELLPLALLLIVFAVPVALPAMFTISMAVGSLELVKQGVLVTRLSASEDAATMDTLCADKTGTITANKLSIIQVAPQAEFREEDVIRYGALASEQSNQDPIDLAFLSAADSRGLTL